MCTGCAAAVDALWLADWRELAAARDESADELAALVLAAPVGTFAWTCVDRAMWLTRCAECGAELGAGPVVCPRCAAADADRWAWDHTARPGEMTTAEHALRVAVAVLRAPHRWREPVVATWRLAVPFLLAGQEVPAARLREIRTGVLAGRYPDLAALDSVAELANLPLPPWRRPG